MSGWWQGEESTESDSENLYSESEDEPENIAEKGPGKQLFFDSDSEDKETRTIRPEKEKRFEEMSKCVKKLRNSMKINDWPSIFGDWETLTKAVNKAKSVIDEHGLPSFYISALFALNELINRIIEDKEFKTMKPKTLKFFNNMKLRLKKYIKDNNLEKVLKDFKENPVVSDEEGEEPDKSETSESVTKTKSDLASSVWTKKSDETSEEDMWDDDDLSESDADEGEDFLQKDLSYWFTKDEAKPSKKEKKPNEKRNKSVVAETAKLDETEKDKKAQEGKKAEPKELTPEKIDEKIKEMLKDRGTKGYSAREHIKVFRELLPKIDDLGKKTTLRFHIINAQLDAHPNVTHLPIQMWKLVYNEIVTILDTLFENPHLKLYEQVEDGITSYDITKHPPNHVYGHLLFSIERLHEEFMRSMQNIDPHSQDYIKRLAHERDILLLLQYAEKYYQQNNDLKNVAAIAFRELEYLYYKRSADGGGIEEVNLLAKDDADADDEPEIPEDTPLEEDAPLEEAPPEEKFEEVEIHTPKDVTPYTNLKETVNRLCSLVYKYSTEDRHKRRAMIQQIYHLALHDMFYEARDLMLMTHLQEKIYKAKATTQVMFNRAMVQLGLAAFRKGRIEDANNCLQDIVQNGKAKELLAQGIKLYATEKSTEQEKHERRRQVPYHMHINLDLIECVQLVSAMLLEIPNIAQTRFRDTKRKVVISRHFRRMLDYYERQVFTGPPENTRESVIMAAKALEQGNWTRCRDLIIKLDIWKLLPKNEATMKMIERQIQEQALRTYLFTYGQYYDSVSIADLAAMFNLEKNTVHAIASKMIISEELYASLDQTTGSIIVHGQDPTQLQHLALTLAEKATILGDTSEAVEQRVFEKRWPTTAAQSATGVTVPEQRGTQKANTYTRGGRYGASPRSDRQFARGERGRKQARIVTRPVR